MCPRRTSPPASLTTRWASATRSGIAEQQSGGTPTAVAEVQRAAAATDAGRRDRHTLWREVKKNRALLYLITPGVLYFVVFHYLPIYGISFAFVDYSPKYGQGVVANYLTSPWIGFKHFIDFFTGPKFFPLLRNTLVLGFYSVAFEFPAAILFAVCLYEVQNTVYRKFAQTISFLPHFISTVSVVAMMVMLFSPSNGYVNWLLNSIGIEPIYFMAEPGWFRPLYVGSSIWAGIGWGAIIYLAAMFGIPASLYESAAIDGATRWQNIRSITLPDYGLGGYAGAFPEFLAMNVRNLPMLTAKEDFDHLPAVGFVYGGFTPQEIDDKVDLETIMQDTFKEYTLKFVIGQNDINSDPDWEAYIAALQQAGLAEYERVYQAAWDRAPFF